MAEMLFKWLFLAILATGQGAAGFPGMLKGGNAQAAIPVLKHPFYLAVTEINHNAQDKTLEISCKMFAEDLEQILEKNNKAQLDISAEKDKSSFDKYIPAYVASHLSLSVDGKAVALSYVGFEKEKESAFCYFQVEHISSLKKLNISNTILYDFNEGQSNIIHITVNGKRQSTRLNFPEKQAGFEF